MKMIERIAALMMVAVLTFSLAGCLHKKNEIAVTIGDIKFTSAYYMCALVNANMEAKQKVSETLSDEDKEKEVNYYSKKVDNKKFVDWVEDRAVEILKETAAFKQLCDKNNVKLSDELKAEATQSVTTLWDSYGYSVLYEPNGVSRDTYAKFTEDSYYSEAYFESLYGKGGTKEIAEDEVSKEITDNYVLLDKISVTYDANADAAKKTESKSKLDDYASQIKSGKKTFIEIYKTHNDIKEESTAEEDEELKPINTYATISGAEGTSFEDENFKTYKGYEVDAVQVVENSSKTGYDLIIKRDITADAYYMDYLDSFARHAIKDEDYKKEIEKQAKKLKPEINSYAIGQFKVKKIIEPEV
ncbi:MAG: hypothetical protein J6B22_01840 [Clostridia bacterium]|nr:hypothetical protein [Clostridia bacterium]